MSNNISWQQWFADSTVLFIGL